MEKQQLTNLGLTDGESKVYLALLKIGSSTVGSIVKESKVAYSNIYEILNRLIEKGLVSFILKEKTRHYQPAPPSRLNDFLEKKEEELQKEKISLKTLIPKLEKVQNSSSKQEAEIFIGLKGIKTAYHRLFEEYYKDRTEWLFFHVEEGGDIADEFYSRLYPKSKKISKDARGIANKRYKNTEFAKKANFNMKYINFPIPGNIDILKDKLLFITWSETPMAVLITSKDMAEKFKDYFYSIWNPKT